MSSEKLITVFGLNGKSEATYNGGGSLSSSTDGILLAEPLRLRLNYLFDGARPRGPGTGGQARRNVPKGRWCEGTARIHGRGAGVAYDDAPVVVARDLDTFLRANGRLRTIDATGGAEKVTYALTALKTDWASGVLAGYTDEELIGITGVYSGLRYTIDGLGPMIFDFPFRGSWAIPDDAAVPTISYQSPTLMPPLGDSLVVTVGDYVTPRFRKIEYDSGRMIGNPRPFGPTAGLVGFALGHYAPVVKLTIEKTAEVGSPFHTVAGLQPHELRDRGTVLAVSIDIGAAAGAYNGIQHLWAQAQIADVEDDPTDPEACWVLTIVPFCTPAADDGDSIILRR